MAANTVVEKFSRIIEKVFSQKTERIELQLDFDDKYQHLFKNEYETVIKIIISVKDADTLSALMKSYLELYGRYSYNKNNIHFYGSDQTFKILIQQSARVSYKSGDLFEIWDGWLTGNKISDSYNSFKKRFAELSKTIQSEINAFRVEEREKRRKSKSILDVLKDEYARQYGPFKTIDELYDFDPKTSVTVRSELEKQIARVMPLWKISKGIFTKTNATIFNTALLYFKLFVKRESGKNVLILFQIIKYLQDSFRSKVEKRSTQQTGVTDTIKFSGDPHELVLLYALYAIACIQLMEIAQVNKLLARNRHGFTIEEITYFLKPIRAEEFAYTSNLEKLFTDPFKNTDILFEQIKLFLTTYMLTKNQLVDADLVNLQRTLEIQHIWERVSTLTNWIKQATEENNPDKIKAILTDPKNQNAIQDLIDISQTEVDLTGSGPELGKAKFRAGNKVGGSKYGDVTIVYINPKNNNDIYIEFESLKPQLFLVHKNYIHTKFYSSQILEIYRSTIGIVYVTEFIFLAMGFLPVLIEAGFAGLIYELAVFYASQKLEEQVSKIHPGLGKTVGLLAQIVTPRPSFKPKVVDPVTKPRGTVDKTGLSETLNVATKDKALLDKAINPQSQGINRLNTTELDRLISKISVENEFAVNNSGLSLNPKALKGYMLQLKEGGRFPNEWEVIIKQSEPLRKMIDAAEKVRLVKIAEKQMKTHPYQFQRSSMGSEHELHLTIGGREYKLDGIIIDGQGKSWIGESKFTFKGDYDKFYEAGKLDPASSYHHKFLDEKVIPQFRGYSDLAKKYGFEGVAVYTNTEFLWATFEQTTRYLKNVEIVIQEHNWKAAVTKKNPRQSEKK